MTSAITPTENQIKAKNIATVNGETEFTCDGQTFHLVNGQWMVLIETDLKLGSDKPVLSQEEQEQVEATMTDVHSGGTLPLVTKD
ncbi:hypothetical protein ACJ7VZ_05285 [Aeromonas salmonicida]|uniref:hypothetical protein n=1 Tax=Aeromonas salmonicida TaxID=645 RepID=UPI0038B96ADF